MINFSYITKLHRYDINLGIEENCALQENVTRNIIQPLRLSHPQFQCIMLRELTISSLYDSGHRNKKECDNDDNFSVVLNIQNLLLWEILYYSIFCAYCAIVPYYHIKTLYYCPAALKLLTLYYNNSIPQFFQYCALLSYTIHHSNNFKPECRNNFRLNKITVIIAPCKPIKMTNIFFASVKV